MKHKREDVLPRSRNKNHRKRDGETPGEEGYYLWLRNALNYAFRKT